MKSSALNVNTIILGFHQGSFFFPDPQEDMNPIVGIELWGVLVVFFFSGKGTEVQDMSWKSSKEISKVKQSSTRLGSLHSSFSDSGPTTL